MTRITTLIALSASFFVCGFQVDEASAQTSSLFGSSRSSGGGTATGSRGNTGTAGGGGTNPNNGAFQSLLNTEAGVGGVSTDFGNGLVGRSDNAGRFIGSQFAGQQQSRINSGSNFNGGGFGRGGFNTGNFAQFGQYGNNSQSRARKIRPRQRIAFKFPRLKGIHISNSLGVRFKDISVKAPALKGLGIKVDDKGTAVLTGSVVDDHAKRLAANLVRLEPGVRKIDNQLQVASAKTTE